MALIFLDGFEQYKDYNDLLGGASQTPIPSTSRGRWRSTSTGGSEPIISTAFFGTAQPSGVSKSLYMNNANSFVCLDLGDYRSELYIGFALRYTNSTTTALLTLSQTADIYNPSSGIRIRKNADLSLSVESASPSQTLFSTAANVISLNSFYYIELKAVFNDTSGSVELKVDGVTRGSFSGDTRGGLSNQSGYRYATWLVDNGNGAPNYIDDLYVCDGSGGFNNSFLGGVSVYTLLPESNGASTGMTAVGAANNWDCVNDTDWDTTTYVKSSANLSKDLYNLPSLPVNPARIAGVALGNKSCKGDNGSRLIRNKVKTDVGDADGLSNPTTLNTYKYSYDIMEKQPDGNEWTKAVIDTMQIGIESL